MDKLSEYINKDLLKFIMSCNLTEIILEIPKLVRIHIRTRNKLGGNLKQKL